MSVMRVPSHIRDYEVHFAPGAEFLVQLAALPRRCFVVDQSVWDLYRDTCLQMVPAAEAIILPVSEELKTLQSVTDLYDQLVERQFKRNLMLISIGGGICQDVTGFAASTLYRGIPWIFVPTTLLAQADSCIGAKTSLNYKRYKNLLGTFYPPTQIFLDTAFLATQKDPDYFSGLGEVVKLHLMGGAQRLAEIQTLLPALLRREKNALNTAVCNSLAIKLEYISQDEFDTGRRNLLNFGHCFGHAIEATSNFAIPHGQAVVVGMILANAVACRRGLLSAAQEVAFRRNLLLPSLVVKCRRPHLDHAAVIAALGKDKKRTGAGLAMILLQENLDLIRVDDVRPEEVAAALAQAAALGVWAGD